MRNRAIAATLVAVLVTVSLPAAGQGVPEGPEGLHVSLGTPAHETAVVTFSGPPAVEAFVEVGGPGAGNRTVPAQAHALPGDDETGYRASVGDLEPGTNYTYRAALDGATSETFTFRTPPAPGSNETVRITAFGDQGVPASPHPDRADGDAPLENTRLAAGLNPDVHALAGDISYADGDPAIWDIYFRKNEPLWATTPTMTVPGNHEREPGQGYSQYDARLTMPEPSDTGRWWTVQVGNVQLVGLNSDTICAESQAVQAAPTTSYYCGAYQGGQARQPNERQLSFVEETLSAAEEDPTVDWTVVVYHNPTYSTGSHGSNGDVQALWVPLFEEHGVDVVLNGDDHLYQRTHPLVDGTPAEEGPVYIVNGLGGSDTYSFQDGGEPPEWEAARYNEAYGTVVLDASGDRLEGRFVNLDGTTVDVFTLVGGADGSPRAVDGNPDSGNGTAGTEGGPSSAETPAPGALAAVGAALAGALAVRRRPAT